MVASTFNIADLFEQAADEWPDHPYLADERTRRTYAEMDSRANRLAHHLAAQGIGPGDRVGIYAYNRAEWVEALWAVFKLRAVWVNINYRYVHDELRYLFDQADLSALVVEPQFAEPAAAAAPHVPQLVIGPDYEAALAAQPDRRDFAARSNDDHYILFTGGTTGLPKGVVWRHEDVVMALGGGVDIRTGEVLTAPDGFVAKGNNGFRMVSFPLPPLMHGATQWNVMGQAFIGGSMVLRARFDAADVWRTVAAERVNSLFITGDAMARPLLDSYETEVAAGRRPDTSSLFMVASSAVLFSQHSKDRFFELFPELLISDSVGSSEGGANGFSLVTKGTVMKGGPTVTAAPQSLVVDEELMPVAPGSGVIGRLARRGNIPVGYLDDPVKTAQVFVTAADGTRYVIPGDYAMVEADGSITLLGRGSVSINSGGEKIFPEEVENALKAHPDVYDAMVVGVPDERWGERVVAIVAPVAGTMPTLSGVQDHCRNHVAGYKIPRDLVIVAEVPRSPSGKLDYRWAKRVAMGDPSLAETPADTTLPKDQQ